MAKYKLGHISSLAGGATEQLGTIDVTRTRTMTATVRVTYDGAATGAVQLKYYHIPSGQKADTVPISTETIDLTAGATVQKTVFIAAPEDGELSFVLTNTDASHAATNIDIFLTYSKWPEMLKLE